MCVFMILSKSCISERLHIRPHVNFGGTIVNVSFDVLVPQNAWTTDYMHIPSPLFWSRTFRRRATILEKWIVQKGIGFNFNGSGWLVTEGYL